METPSTANRTATPDDLEEEIKAGLLGSESEQEVAFEKAYARFAKPLAAFIRETIAPTLDSDEIATAVSETFCALGRYVEKGRFSKEGALSTILFSIARFKAIDLLRSKTCIKRCNPIQNDVDAGGCDDNQPDENFAVRISQQLVKAPEIKELWKTAVEIGYANEVMRQFRLCVGELPHLQRKVGEAILAHFGNVSDEEFGPVSTKEICDYIAKHHDHRPAEASVRSARKEITRKFKTLIQPRKE